MDKEKNNILLILTDEQRLSEFGAYGSTPCKTPNLDRLAKESVLFENAYTTCPLCSPARATVLTGLYPHSHGITCNTADTGCNVQELNDSPFLLPRIMPEYGYSCGYNGKWHLGSEQGNMFNSNRKPAVPSDFGFEGLDFPGHGGIGMGYPQYKKYLSDNNYELDIKINKDMGLLHYGTWSGGKEIGVPHFITDCTISLMEDFRRRNKPFFMHHNFWGPHLPYFVPEEYFRMYENVEIPEWENFNWEPAEEKNSLYRIKWLPGSNRKNWKAWEKLIKHKYAFMTYIDHQIGRMLDYLDKSGLRENTTIIFTSDHGDNLGGHGGLASKGFGHFEDTHHIPLLINQPETAPEIRKDLTSLADIYPTILDIAGINSDAKTHGHSLLDKSVPPREYVVTEFHGLNSVVLTMRTIRSGNLKYGWTCVGSDELYDLEKDPNETVNLIDDPAYSRELVNLKLMLRDWMKETADKAIYYYESTNLE